MKCKISSNARMLLSCGVLIAFALIAGASTDEIGVFLVIGVVAVVIVGIVAIVNEQMKKSARKSMEDSMSSDFQITKKSLMENDFALTLTNRARRYVSSKSGRVIVRARILKM